MTKQQQVAEKVWVVGLDGATFDLLQPMMDSGLLPNLTRLATEGVRGRLNSTVPPVTAPAWTSFMTGVNPGKHGVFDFTVRTAQGLTWANSRAVRAPKLWNIVSADDKRVGVINVPVTYPVEPVNGYIIPGFLTPQGAAEFTHPPELRDELEKAVGGYVINVKIAGRESGGEATASALVSEIQDAVAKREAALQYLLDNHKTDFLMIVFMSLDKVQHVFWKYLDPQSPLYHTGQGKRYRELVIPCYEQIDAVVGRLMARCDAHTTLILMSDHGFGTLDKYLDLNRWLADRGLFRLRKGRVLFRELQRRLGITGVTLPQLHGGVAADPKKMDCIDWKRTLAFCGEISGQGIFINLRGRDPQGVVEPGPEYDRVRDQIIDGLLNWREPGSDHPIVDRVYKREELYTGAHVDKAPDLLVVMRNYSYLLLNSVRFTQQGYLREIDDARGFHRPDGVFLAWGHQISSGKQVNGAEIIDLAPTILHLLGVPVPQNMDGKVLESMFVPDSPADRAVVYQRLAKDDALDESDIFSAEEAETIRQRLRDLGYLGQE
jgi:predicted AlkP superfamily phosphohydrolase/phosphomutase